MGVGPGHAARQRIGSGWPTSITSIRDGALNLQSRITDKLQFWT
jgi:hypothetical protein